MRTPALKRLKFAVILFYLSLFAGLALYDEKPDPELAQKMAKPLPEAVEPGNAWIAFLGFTSPKGVSPYAHGVEKIRKLQKTVLTINNSGNIFSSVDNDGEPGLSFLGDVSSFYDTKDGRILGCAAAHPDRIADLLGKNKELLERYKSLRAYPRYTEALDYGYYMPIPMFSPLRNAQRTILLQLTLRANRGDMAGALAELRNDAQFWRFIARNSTTLLSKLISISFLSTDIRFAAELGASRHLKINELKTVVDILRPFDGETGMAEAFRGEARWALKGMELTCWQSAKWKPESLVLKRNATGNRMYADYKGLIRFAEMTPRQFAAERKHRESNDKGVRRIGLPFLYNSTGEILATIALPNFTAYIEKGHNLEGVRRLSLLKVLARRENIPPYRMQQFLDSHATDLGSPYSEAPMSWDAKKGSISFTDASGEKSVDILL